MIPVPLFDVVVDIGVLVKLVPEINRRFGLEPEQIEAMPEETRLQVWKRRAERGSELIGMVVTRELIRRSLQGMGRAAHALAGAQASIDAGGAWGQTSKAGAVCQVQITRSIRATTSAM